MAAQVLAGKGNVSYTNNTGQNVRLVINYIMGSGLVISWGQTGLDISLNTQQSEHISYGKYLAFHHNGANVGSFSNSCNNWSDGGVEPLPMEIPLANGHTFKISGTESATHNLSQYGPGGFNILVVPESG